MLHYVQLFLNSLLEACWLLPNGLQNYWFPFVEPRVQVRGLHLPSQSSIQVVAPPHVNKYAVLIPDLIAPDTTSDLQDTEVPSDIYYLGRSYFDMKEYERASITLKPIRSGPGRFLGLYARFLSIEKRLNDVSGPALCE